MRFRRRRGGRRSIRRVRSSFRRRSRGRRGFGRRSLARRVGIRM